MVSYIVLLLFMMEFISYCIKVLQKVFVENTVVPYHKYIYDKVENHNTIKLFELCSRLKIFLHS